jgi:hypothetical protein
MIARGSEGIPRNINNLCFNALSIGCALRKKRIDRDVAEEALDDQKFESRGRAGNVSQPTVSTAPQPAVAAVRRPLRVRMRQAALIAAAVLIAGVLGGLSGLYAAHIQSLLRPLMMPKPVMTLSDTPTPPVPVPPVPAAEPVPDSAPPTPAAREQELVIVGPHQTLTEISKLHLGEYNAAVLTKLRELNPGLGDPDHLEVGQQIRFPGAAEGENGANGESEERRETTRNSR